MNIQAHLPSGDEWQTLATQLLVQHYGVGEYQRVPDTDRGDAGIEGYAISACHAYQIYGPEEPLTTKQRFEAHRNKMTRDIEKFITNEKVLSKILGKLKIRRWILFVPKHDSKELNIHAARKTEEVLSIGLHYVASDFQVVICDQEDFAAELNKVVSAGLKQIDLEVISVTNEDLTNWASEHDGLCEKLQKKLSKLPTLTNENERQKFHFTVLRWSLDGKSALDSLRKYPELYDKVSRAKNHKEKLLALQGISGEPPQELLLKAVNELRDLIHSEIKELHAYSAETLALEAVAEWLLRCPLDFPGAAVNA